MKKLILIRHAQTDYMLNNKSNDYKDIPLNKKGIRQALSLKTRLNNIKIDKVCCSDLKRALQTAAIVFDNKIIYKLKRLREFDSKCENVENFIKRVTACFDKIFTKNSKKTVALVSHGGPIRIILLRLLNQPLDKFWDIQQAPAALNVIEFQNKKAKIIGINDISHLR